MEGEGIGENPVCFTLS